MKLSELKEEYARDVIIDRTSLEGEAARVPLVHSKWLNYRSTVKTMITKAERDLDACRRDRFFYYTGRHHEDICDEVFERSEIKHAMLGDPNILTHETRLAHAKNSLTFVEDALRGVSTLGFTIKHIIDIRKMELGIV